jgi:hypothetical protein
VASSLVSSTLLETSGLSLLIMWVILENPLEAPDGPSSQAPGLSKSNFFFKLQGARNNYFLQASMLSPRPVFCITSFSWSSWISKAHGILLNFVL